MKDTEQITLEHPLFKDNAKTLSSDAKQLLVDRINSIIDTDENGEFFEQSLLDYSSLIKNTRYTVEQYINAIRYCSLKMIMPKYKAWGRVFPTRLATLEQKAKDNNWCKQDFVKTAGSYATTYERNPLTVSVDSEMMIPTHLLYAGYRNKAVEKLISLMDGKASVGMSYVYEKDESGKFTKDADGRRIKLLDSEGKPVIEEYLQSVTPKVQGEMASKLLDITEIPTDRQVNVKIKHSLSDELVEAQKRAQETFLNISKNQRELVLKGESIDSVQQIGNVIEASIIGDDTDIGEDPYYED